MTNDDPMDSTETAGDATRLRMAPTWQQPSASVAARGCREWSRWSGGHLPTIFAQPALHLIRAPRKLGARHENSLQRQMDRCRSGLRTIALEVPTETGGGSGPDMEAGSPLDEHIHGPTSTGCDAAGDTATTVFELGSAVQDGGNGAVVSVCARRPWSQDVAAAESMAAAIREARRIGQRHPEGGLLIG